MRAYTVLARLVKGKRQWRWVIDDCPYCHKRHWHNGGELSEDPRQGLGHVPAHCARPPWAGYILQERPAFRPVTQARYEAPEARSVPWWAR